ncbi:MAG TPA: hypothetical protein VLW83_09535 [Candidatus Acidoferrales bacterium]|nr:hypothetical protein [Candidatus Acidoferrales bacterium]
MDPLAIFGLSVLMSLISSIVAATLLVSPWLRVQSRREALLWLVTPHMFLRFIGLSFLVPGVVSESLPKAMAVPAAYGDCAAGILAIVAVAALARTASWAIAAVWIFNVWGAADFLFAIYQGARVQLVPGWLGASFYIVTAIVPPLLVSHVLIFRELRRSAP